MANKVIIQSDMWAVWNPDFGFYVDTRLTRKEMIYKHTSDLGMTWDECKKTGDRVMRVQISAAQPLRAVDGRVRGGKKRTGSKPARN